MWFLDTFLLFEATVFFVQTPSWTVMISCLIWLPRCFRPAEGKANKQMTASPVTVHTHAFFWILFLLFFFFFFLALLRWPTAVVMTTLAIWVFGRCLVRGPATGSSLLTSFLQGSCLTQPLTQESGCLSPRGSAILLGTTLQGTGEWAGAQEFAEVSWRQKMPGGRGRGSYTGPGWGHLSVYVCVRYMGENPANFHTHLRAEKEGVRCKCS